jgi:tetrahydromethanopterin S-methyltransferase subunit G
LDNIIKKIHILNTRFTNIYINDSEINKINKKLMKIHNKYNSYSGRLKTIIKASEDSFDDKLNIEEKVIGVLPTIDIQTKKNELIEKLALLRDILISKKDTNEANNILNNIDHFENIDTAHSLEELNEYNDEIDNILNKLSNIQEGGNNPPLPVTQEDLGTVYNTINVHNKSLQDQLKQLETRLSSNNLTKEKVIDIYSHFLSASKKDDNVIKHLRELIQTTINYDDINKRTTELVKIKIDEIKQQLNTTNTNLASVQGQLKQLFEGIKSSQNPENIKPIIVKFLSNSDVNDPIIKNLHEFINKYLNNPSIPLRSLIQNVETRLSEVEKKITT